MGKKNKKGKKNQEQNPEYDPTADMFAGVETAPMPGSGAYFQDGTYLVRLELFKRGMSRKMNDGPFTVAEFTVLDVLVQTANSNVPGQRLSWVSKSKWGESALSAQKGFAAAALGVKADKITAAVLQRISAPGGDADLRGLDLVATAQGVPTQAGGVFTKVTFSTPESYAVEGEGEDKAAKKAKKAAKKAKKAAKKAARAAE